MTPFKVLVGNPKLKDEWEKPTRGILPPAAALQNEHMRMCLSPPNQALFAAAAKRWQFLKAYLEEAS